MLNSESSHETALRGVSGSLAQKCALSNEYIYFPSSKVRNENDGKGFQAGSRRCRTGNRNEYGDRVDHCRKIFVKIGRELGI